MKSRTIMTGSFYRLQQRTDGWYVQRMQFNDPWQGPYRYKELFEVLAEELEAEATFMYKLLFKESPR